MTKKFMNLETGYIADISDSVYDENGVQNDDAKIITLIPFNQTDEQLTSDILTCSLETLEEAQEYLAMFGTGSNEAWENYNPVAAEYCKYCSEKPLPEKDLDLLKMVVATNPSLFELVDNKLTYNLIIPKEKLEEMVLEISNLERYKSQTTREDKFIFLLDGILMHDYIQEEVKDLYESFVTSDPIEGIIISSNLIPYNGKALFNYLKSNPFTKTKHASIIDLDKALRDENEQYYKKLLEPSGFNTEKIREYINAYLGN